MKIRKQKLFYLLLCLFAFFVLCPISAHARGKGMKTVRVGWYEDSYHITGKNGEKSGYGYEYEQTVAAYTGWKYEYVKGDWSELLEMLKNGEIDMMGVISYTDERAQSMLFSELPMGEEKFYLYADLSKMNLSLSDLTVLNGKKIAMLKDSLHEVQFRKWEKKHGVKTEHVYISSFEDSMNKLKSGEADGVLSAETPEWGKSGMSAVLSFGGAKDYFAINKKCPDIKAELDTAMQKMELNKPFYADELYKKYLSSESVEVLSGEEKIWLEKHGKIRIGYLNNDSGVSVLDEESGEITGVIRDYVSYAKKCLQNASLEFELIGYDTGKEQLNALKENKIDMIFHTSQNPDAAEKNGYILSDTVWSFHFAAITANDFFAENEENRVAVAKESIALKQYISYCYPQWEIVECDTMQKAETAVKSGQADCLIARSSQVAKYIQNRRLHSVFLTQPGNTSFAVKRGNTVLLSILNKTLMTTQTTKFTSAVAAYDYSSEKTTLGEFIRENMFASAVVLIGIFLVVLFIVLIFLRKANKATNEAVKLNKKLAEKQRDLEKALVQAESANEAKTTFLSNMSHDIRTPINGIIGMLLMIRKSEDNPEQIKDCLDKIDASSKLLLSLVNDVLDMAKLEADNIDVDNESINLDEVCNEITASMSFQAEAEGLTITGEHDDYTGVNVWSNALYLKKILMNLFSNSMKYNKPKGSINMSMRTVEKTEEYITCEFKIRDTGVGMSEEFIQNGLFTPFAQEAQSARSSYRGTGLGMPIVKQLVEKMGGTLTIESELGEGSCFTVVIPFRLDRQEKAQEKEEAADTDITGLRILVAEDNELNMEIARFILEDGGAFVEPVSNGLEAVHKFEASDEEAFDVILMDIMMPVMDGITATKTIRAMERPDAKTIPIIAMTANAFKEDEEKCMAAGMNAHLAKPLEEEKVVRAIYENINR